MIFLLQPKTPASNQGQASGGSKTLFMGNIPFGADFEQV
jgi:hypothetical protein